MQLGDTPARDYSAKLRLFNAFAATELQASITGLNLRDGMQVLDVGCGTGEALGWLSDCVAPGGAAFGVDLSAAHVRQAALRNPGVSVVQGDVLTMDPPGAPYDLIWSANTVNHFADPIDALRRFQSVLRPAGRIALGQSAFLPDMFLAWDARLEQATTQAIRRYYQDRYQVSDAALTGIRALVGILRSAGFAQVTAVTRVIERVSPLDALAYDYLFSVLFEDQIGEKLRPYLSERDFEALQRLRDPDSDEFALRRADFHFIQTFTLVVGTRE